MNYGFVDLAAVTSGQAQLVAAVTGSNIANSAVRVFDLVLCNTAASISFHAGTSTAGTKYILLDKTNSDIHSNVGMRFAGGVFVNPSATAGALATISYIHEF